MEEHPFGIGKCAEKAVTTAQCGESRYLTDFISKHADRLEGYIKLIDNEIEISESAKKREDIPLWMTITFDRIGYLQNLLRADIKSIRHLKEQVEK